MDSMKIITELNVKKKEFCDDIEKHANSKRPFLSSYDKRVSDEALILARAVYQRAIDDLIEIYGNEQK